VKAEATAGAVQRETIAHRLVALEEEVAAFGARAETAATIGGEDAMTALYVAEARAHARALVRVARLEASIASGTRLDTKLEEGVHAEKAETTEMDAKEAEETAEEPASPSGVENVASEAAALSGSESAGGSLRPTTRVSSSRRPLSARPSRPARDPVDRRAARATRPRPRRRSRMLPTDAVRVGSSRRRRLFTLPPLAARERDGCV
jgi:hypothetical protein